MAETLFIHLGCHASDSVSWLIWQGADQTIIASGELSQASELTQLTDKANNRKVISLVDASAVGFKSLNVPAKNNRAMQLAAPYALEDDLANDVDLLFFAYATNITTENDHNCHLGVVAKQQMEQWQQWLTDAGIFCQQMIPDALLLPWQQEQISLVKLGSNYLVKTSAWHCASIAPAIMPLWLQQQANIETPITLAHFSPITLDLPEQITAQAMPEELPLALLAQQVDSASFNLLQGEYEVKSPSSASQKWWQVAAALAASLVIMLFVVKMIHLQQLTSQVAKVEQQIISEYKRLVPNAKRVRVTTVKSQLKRLLQQAGTSGDSDLFQLLNQVQAGFKATPSLKPTSIKFDAKRGELRLQANASSYQDFERFKATLEQQKLQVTQGALNNQGEQISGSYSIKG